MTSSPANAALPAAAFGLGLRAPHYEDILNQKPALDFFEILTENYLDAHEGYWDYLADLRALYPLALHGVSLSIGGLDPLDDSYLGKLERLIDALDPALVSDHLCFTGLGGHTTHDLLPLPYTEEALAHVARRISQVQERLGRQLVLENPSTYLEFAASSIPEAEFLAELAHRTGCGLLLDVNNIYVSAFNHGFDARRYIEAIPAASIAQIHLAGHLHKGSHIIDTHDDHVANEVWSLYAHVVARTGPHPTLIEWDDRIPPLDVLLAELTKARTHAEFCRADGPADALCPNA